MVNNIEESGPRGFESSGGVETFKRILAFLAGSSQVELEEESLVKVARHFAAEGLPGTFQKWSVLLARAGADLGLNVFQVRASLEDILRKANPKAPFLTYVAGRTLRGWIAIVGRKWRKIRIRPLEGKAVECWVSKGALLQAMGPAEEKQPVEWVAAESAAPLVQMANHEGDLAVGHGLSPRARLRGLLKTEQSDIWVVVIYSAGIGLLSLVVPIAVQALVNTVAFGTVLQPLVVLTILVFLGMTFGSVMYALRTYVVEIIQQRTFVRVATDTVYRLLGARLEAFDRTHAPELVNRFFDVVTVQKSGATLLVDGLSLAMQTLVGMILLALYHPFLLVFDVFLLLLIIVILFSLGSGAIPTSIKESKSKYEIAAWLEEIARYLTTFKSSPGYAFALETADLLVSNYLVARSKHFRILLRQIMGFLALQTISSAVLLGFGGWLVIQRQLTLGQLVAAELVVTMVVGGLTRFGKQMESYYDLLAAVDKLGHLLDLPLERKGGESLPRSSVPASVRFRAVSFGFPNQPAILQNVNWEIPSGVRYGLMGRIGSGKSTIADLVYGLRSPDSGSLEIDDFDCRTLNLMDLRGQVALVRGSDIFEGTISDNIRLGRSDIDTAAIRRALASAGLLEQVLALPQGLETKLATGGLPLSPGQAQRLILARAIATAPRLMVLDEILDHVERYEERQEILKTLLDPAAPWTLIILSETPDVLKACERVFVLKNGQIVAMEPENSQPSSFAREFTR